MSDWSTAMSDWSTTTPEQIIADIQAMRQRIRDEYLAVVNQTGIMWRDR